jgi:hypothetical protein
MNREGQSPPCSEWLGRTLFMAPVRCRETTREEKHGTVEGDGRRSDLTSVDTTMTIFRLVPSEAKLMRTGSSGVLLRFQVPAQPG